MADDKINAPGTDVRHLSEGMQVQMWWEIVVTDMSASQPSKEWSTKEEQVQLSGGFKKGSREGLAKDHSAPSVCYSSSSSMLG